MIIALKIKLLTINTDIQVITGPLIQSSKLNQSLISILAKTVVLRYLQKLNFVYLFNFLLCFIFLNKWYKQAYNNLINKQKKNKKQ